MKVNGQAPFPKVVSVGGGLHALCFGKIDGDSYIFSKESQGSLQAAYYYVISAPVYRNISQGNASFLVDRLIDFGLELLPEQRSSQVSSKDGLLDLTVQRLRPQ
jgi:hypothetical protein